MLLNLKTYRNDLLPVYTTDKGNKVVNGRELHSFLGIGKDYSTWAKKMIKTHKLKEDRDFVIITPAEIIIDSSLTQSGEQKKKAHNRKEYIFLLTPAKKISMGTNNEKGNEVKEYFLACEDIAIKAVRKQSKANPLANLGVHTQRPVQIQNSKAVNRHIWENTVEQAGQAIGDYHREVTKAVCGKTPSQLKKEAKAAGMPSKQRTSGREVLRHTNPAAACTLSLSDQLTKSGAQLEDIKPLLNTAQSLYAGIIKLGFTPNELAA